MLIVQVKDGESIDKALKRYKKKFEKAQILKILREKQFFEKKSVKRRQQILRAIHREKLKQQES
ncbi:MAG: 30S ribosomal protein S21 [Vicingaceae bacterium]|jgi:small subunit ribosomal protein S21|nr:MAG: 30S ribosomal protein S21 [Vicingaceae bacterium]